MEKRGDIRMERDFDLAELISKLRTGETVKCLKCGKGHYITNAEYIKTSHSFWCDNCNDILHATSAIIVE